MQLYIKNFQNISEETIDLSGFTVFTGRSNSGKSSIRRALELVLYNKWHIGHLKNGTDHCIVKLTLDEKNYIQITKPENTYTVLVNGVKSVYPKVAKNILEELYDLGLDFFRDSEGYEHNVHIRSQTDPWYYISYSQQEQSRIIASIFNFDEIKNVLKRAYKDKSLITSEAENTAETIDELKVEVDNLGSKLKLLNSLKQKTEIKNQIELHLGLNSQINTLSEEINKLVLHKNSLEKIIKSSSILILLQDWHSFYYLSKSAESVISENKKSIKSVNEQILSLNNLKTKLDHKKDLINILNINKDLEIVQKTLKDLLLAKQNNSIKLDVLNSILSGINKKTILSNYIKNDSIIYSNSMYLKDSISELKLVIKNRNMLIRYNSLQNFLDRKSKYKKIKKSLEKDKNTISVISNTLSKLSEYKTINKYIEDIDTINSIESNVVKITEEVNYLNKEIFKYKEELNGSILCPHCNGEIGSFVIGCQNV